MNFKDLNPIMALHLNPYWSPMSGNVLYKREELNPSDPEYARLRNKMKGKFLKEFLSVERIQNPVLYEQFNLKLAECQLLHNFTIRELYHSTAHKNVEPIIEDNLDWRLCSRTRYGQGISFSPDPSYANLQSAITNGIKRAMIVADVIIGYTQIGNIDTVIPDDGYDTTVSENNTVIVKYYDNEYYPKYVINYETYEVKKNKYGRYYEYAS